MASIKCPKCSSRLKLPDGMEGKRATCPNCDAKFEIPAKAPTRDTSKPSREPVANRNRTAQDDTDAHADPSALPQISTTDETSVGVQSRSTNKQTTQRTRPADPDLPDAPKLDPAKLPKKVPADLDAYEVAFGEDDIRRCSGEALRAMLLSGTITRHFFARRVRPKPTNDQGKSDGVSSMAIKLWKADVKWQKLGQRVAGDCREVRELYGNRERLQGGLALAICMVLSFAGFVVGMLVGEFEIPEYKANDIVAPGVFDALIPWLIEGMFQTSILIGIPLVLLGGGLGIYLGSVFSTPLLRLLCALRKKYPGKYPKIAALEIPPEDGFVRKDSK